MPQCMKSFFMGMEVPQAETPSQPPDFFSTSMEVNLGSTRMPSCWHRLLHDRGGPPCNVQLRTIKDCFLRRLGGLPRSCTTGSGAFSLLHGCGGLPLSHPESVLTRRYSPWAWRSTIGGDVQATTAGVFSAGVEVNRSNYGEIRPPSRSLHSCGGQPFENHST